MNISVEKQPNCIARLRVEIPEETVKKERNGILSIYHKQARIPGFRKGKVPRKIIERRFAEGIKEELEERLTNKAFNEALQKEQLKVLEFGKPENFTESPDGSVTFESTFVLAPEFTLPNYKGLSIKAGSLEVSDEELDRELQNLREQLAEFEDIEGRGAESGDVATLDYKGSHDGKEIKELIGEETILDGQEGFRVLLEEPNFLPGFSEQLYGLEPGNSRTVTVTIEDEFIVEAARGKEFVYEVSLKKLEKQILPELDDEFAATFIEGADLEELKDEIRHEISHKKEKAVENEKVQQIIDQLSSSVDFELPTELLQAETQQEADKMVQHGAHAGLSDEQITAQQAEIFQAAEARARTSLKTNFILQEIAAAENIVVSEYELASRIAEYAVSVNEKPEKMIRRLDRENRIPGLRNQMLVQKAIDFVLEHADIQEENKKEDSQEDSQPSESDA